MTNRLWAGRRGSFAFVLAVVACAAAGARPAPGASVLEPALTMADIDSAASGVYRGGAGGKPEPVTEAVLASVLGLGKQQDRSWAAERAAQGHGQGQPPQPVHFLLAFRKPVAVGSIHVAGTAPSVRVAKSGADGVPRPGEAAAWQAVAVPPSQSGGLLVPLATGTTTRAILLTDDGTDGRAELRSVRLLSSRLANITPAALPYGESEYTTPSIGLSAPFTYAATIVTTGGWGHWQNTGKDHRGRVPRPPVSDIEPSWFILTWREPQTVAGLWLADNFQEVGVEQFAGPEDLNPRAGTNREWKKIKDAKQTAGRGGRWVGFAVPVTTRGLRIVATKTNENAIASIFGLHTLVDLKDAAVPDVAPAVAGAGGQDSPEGDPPVRVPYKLGFDGTMTVVVNTPDGRRVRNLFARREQKKGEHAFGWDLRDEDGRTVPPGEYRWVALAAPPLRYRYEMTPYPNVSNHAPENPAWNFTHHGPGGWLADHTGNRSGAASPSGMVFFGAPVAESGQSFIACDLAGKKQWSIHSFAGFTGAYNMAADDKTVFVTAPAHTTASEWRVDPSTEAVWGVDIKTHAVREIARLQPTAERKRGIQSLATRGGKLYLSIGAPDDWLASAAADGDVDYEACFPRYAPRRKEKFPFEQVPDPRGDFVKLFRLTGTPPGGPGIHDIETTKGKSPRRHVVLAFKRPIAIGSAILPSPEPHGEQPVNVRLSVLKAGAEWPPNPGNPEQWESFERQPSAGWDVATAPKGTMTRALRVTFARGDAAEDELLGADDASEYEAGLTSDGLDTEKDDPAAAGDELSIDGSSSSAWQARLAGVKLFGRRFQNVAPAAEVRVNSGKVAPDGSWDAQRTAPVTESDPGVYALVWKTPQPLRGLGIKEIDGKRTEIDVFTGDGPVDVKADAGWQKAATYVQSRRKAEGYSPDNNEAARYLDGYVDFGKAVKTRAVRLRVVEQWLDVRGVAPRPDVRDKPLDPTRCRVFGVAALTYVGGENQGAVDARKFQRIEVLDTATGKIEREIPVANPGAIGFDRKGQLFAVSGKDVVKVPVAGAESQGGAKPEVVVKGDLIAPQAMAIDSAGNFYVYDHDPKRKNVRVYSPAGKLLRQIGTPGGWRAGAWDPTRFQDVTTLVVDAKDQLWAVEQTYFPKRISLWTADGKFQKDFLGNTGYGGGGVLDPQDKSRVFYGPLEFALDWKTGATRLKNLTWVGDTRAGEVPIRIDDRLYLVTRFEAPDPKQFCAAVYLYEKDHLRRVAAMGEASAFPPLAGAEIQTAFGGKALAGYNFLWSDTNGDDAVQADEVQLFDRTPDDEKSPLTDFDRTLGINAGLIRYEVKSFLPTGVPVYERKKLAFTLPTPGADRFLYRLDNGNYYRLGGGTEAPEAVFSPEGEMLWKYPSGGRSTHGLATAAPYTPEQVITQFAVCGHETAHAGGLGEFFVVHTNLGSWNLWTADGLLAATIFKDQRTPGARGWSMPEHDRGLPLDNVTIGQEHFNGYFTRTADNRYYAIAGHNHVSLVEVLGLDQFKRFGGTIKVSAADMIKSQEWERTRQKQIVYERAPVMDCYRVVSPPKIDANIEDWRPALPAAEFGEKPGNRQITRGGLLRAGWDDEHLYLCYEVRGLGPLKNSGEQADRLFKTGAAVDLQIGLDPAADRGRKAPVKGDKRLLMTFVGEEPRAVLYDAVVPGTAPDAAWKAVSPIGSVSFDRVGRVDDRVRLAAYGDHTRYVVEAAIPLDVLGLKPANDLRLKLDWGVLVTDPAGNAVLQRLYWANGNTGIVADVPSEARLQPDLWGYVLFRDHKAGDAAEPGSKPDDLLGPKETEDDLIKDFEEELKGD